MPSNHLEDLVAEWYEFNGYFVRRNVPVGKRPKGGYECELDIVGFNPTAKRLVHIEPSLDADSWKKREEEKALGEGFGVKATLYTLLDTEREGSGLRN